MSKAKIAKGQAAKKRMKEGNRTKKWLEKEPNRLSSAKVWTVGELLGMTLKQST